MGTKKTPMRMCVSCRTMREKKSLLRLVAVGEEIVCDKTGKLSGRGAYICRSEECLRRAQKSRAIERSLGGKVDWLAVETEVASEPK